MLPGALAHRLVATTPAETSAGTAEILPQALEIEQRVERAVEERLLGELLEEAGAGARARCGLAESLDSLWQGRVQTLVVAEKLQRNGSECPNCGRLEPGDVATCQLCGTAMRPVHDVLHRAMEQALELDGRVEVLHGPAAPRLVEACGGVGALLRF
jgi:peptide subunit release factor 1 (eRF1)